MPEYCNNNGGVSIGAGHECKCVCLKGHDTGMRAFHACHCGSMWTKAQLTPNRGTTLTEDTVITMVPGETYKVTYEGMVMTRPEGEIVLLTKQGFQIAVLTGAEVQLVLPKE